MSPVWQISAGDASEALRPLAFALAALASACVLADARRARLSAAASAAWTLLTLASTPVVLPLYVASRLFTRRRDGEEGAPPPGIDEAGDAGAAAQESADESGAVEDETDESLAVKDEAPGQQPLRQQLLPRLRQGLRRAALPALYAAALLASGGFYFYRDARSADAHLLRASRAKLHDQRGRAIGEYRAALELGDDAHTRKLLGLELAEAGSWEEALAEFQAAARADGSDDTIHFHTARALEALSRDAEAATEYRKFLQTRTCAPATPAQPCEAARAHLDTQRDDAPRP